MAVLSPVNKKTARLFFCYFLPYVFDQETCTFGKMIQKEAKRDKLLLAIGSFIHEPENDIWSWAEEHIQMDVKPANYALNVTKAVEKAIKHEVDKGDILKAMLAGGVTIGDVLSALEAMETEAKKAA
jgi:hypothetical protein